MAKTYISKEKEEELENKLKELKTAGRMEIAERLKKAKEFGDLSENFEYSQAKEDQEKLEKEPLVARVDKNLCSGCLSCIAACPFNAIEKKEVEDRGYRRIVAEVIGGVCSGCGNCAAVCRMSAIDLEGFTNRQIMEEIEAL